MRNKQLVKGKIGRRILALQAAAEFHSSNYLALLVDPTDPVQHSIAAEIEEIVDVEGAEAGQIWAEDKGEGCLVVSPHSLRID